MTWKRSWPRTRRRRADAPGWHRDVSRRLDALGVDHDVFGGGESNGDFIGITTDGITRSFAWSDRHGWTMTQQGDHATYRLEVMEPEKALAVANGIIGVITGRLRGLRTVTQ